MSRAARVRAWLIEAGGLRSAAEVSDGLGAEGKERLMIAWTLGVLARSGQVVREGFRKGTRYEYVRPPTKASKLTAEERRTRRNAAGRARWHRLGGRTREQWSAELAQKRQEKEAARAARKAARDARLRDMPPAKQRDADRKRAARHAAGGMTRAEWLAKVAAGRNGCASAPRPAQDRGNRAGRAPVQQQAVQTGPAETVEQFLARGGRVQALPGIQDPPAPRTIPTWRHAA